MKLSFFLRYRTLIALFMFPFCSFAQLEYCNWFFGFRAGINIGSNGNLTTVSTSSINSIESSSAISDQLGNLLFYSSGDTIWNQSHMVMANGAGLAGNKSATQGVLIVKKPGSPNLYYVFTTDALENNFSNGFCYSVVDMNLAAGQGSVVSKNIFLYGPSTERVAGAMHCNGIDVWIISHEWGSNIFRSYLLTASGVSSVPVISSIGSIHGGLLNAAAGQMKISPTGNKIGVAVRSVNSAIAGAFEVFDFNNVTGVLSNSASLGSFPGAYGCEFSADGSKFYGTENFNPGLHQWDLCAPTLSAVLASHYSVSTLPFPFGLQLATNGKIYGCQGTTSLSVISTPNSIGPNCNFSVNAIGLGGRQSGVGICNIIIQKPPLTFSFSQDLSCTTVTLQAPAYADPANTACFANAGAYQYSWNFGDPLSGTANTSSVASPAHQFSALGTFTVKLKLTNTICNVVDSVSLPVNLIASTLSATSSSASCNGLVNATVNISPSSGAVNYTWSPVNQYGQIATALTPGTYTIYAQQVGGSCISSVVANVPVPQQISVSSSVISGCASGSATISLTGGSGNYTYSWSPGSYTGSSQANLSSGNYVIQVSDLTNSCTVTHTLTVSYLPAPSMSVSPSVTVCAGQTQTLYASGAAGYTWSTGAQTSTVLITPTSNTVLTVTGTGNTNSCVTTRTISVVYSKCLGMPAPGVENLVSVSPNPANDHLKVTCRYSILGFYIRDINSKVVYCEEHPSTESLIDLSSLNDGCYYLEIDLDHSVMIHYKLLILR